MSGFLGKVLSTSDIDSFFLKVSFISYIIRDSQWKLNLIAVLRWIDI